MKYAYKALIITVTVGFTGYAQAQNLDGTLNTAFYGAPRAVQSINTGFGDSTFADGNSSGGSELDAAYGVVAGGNLNLFISGNVEGNFSPNDINVFIDSNQGGQNTLNLTSGYGQPMNGSVFSPGFNANLFLNVNDYAGSLNYDQHVLTAGGSFDTQIGFGSFGLASGIGTATDGTSGITYAFNNQNVAGVIADGGIGSPANPSDAAAVNTGLELVIPLALLGNPTSGIKVLAEINGNGNDYQSNQFLPGLPVGTPNLGSGASPYSAVFSGFSGGDAGFDFSSLPSEYLVVPVPEPSTLALTGLSGMALLLFRRRQK